MPKQKITKQMVLDVAFHIAKNEGMEHVLVKNIAQRLNCSVQPIYSYCANMEQLRAELLEEIADYFQQFLGREIDMCDPFRSTGLAYSKFAQEEPYLFQCYVSRPRSNIHNFEQLYQKECSPVIATWIMENLKLTLAQAQALHLHLAIYNMGINSIVAHSGCTLPQNEIIHYLDQAYTAFLRQIKENTHE